jgi:transposase InsO family protein
LKSDGDLSSIDATLIDLSLALFTWARWQGTQAAVKLNIMLAVTGDLRTFWKWIVSEACTNGLPPERLGEAVHLDTDTSTGIGRAATLTLAESGYRALVAAAVFDYIETISNPKRRHSTIGQIHPLAYEQQLRDTKAA